VSAAVAAVGAERWRRRQPPRPNDDEGRRTAGRGERARRAAAGDVWTDRRLTARMQLCRSDQRAAGGLTAAAEGGRRRDCPVRRVMRMAGLAMGRSRGCMGGR
jgi:hypothetical protein